MDPATKDLLKTVALGWIRTMAAGWGGSLVHAGLLSNDGLSQFEGAVVLIATIIWTTWDKYGRSIVLAQLANLKAHVHAIPPAPAGQPAPAVTAAVNAAKAAASVVLLAISLSLIVGSAHAQTARKPLTGNPVTDIQNAVTGAQTKIVNDLTTVMKQLEGMVDTADAITLSTQIPGLQDTVGNACWKSFDGLSQVMKAHPLPISLKIAPDIEAIRLAAMALNQICTNPNCGQMWTDAQNAATALNVTPMQFSLPSICAKIPAIGTLAGAAVVPVTPAANALGGAPTVTPVTPSPVIPPN